MDMRWSYTFGDRKLFGVHLLLLGQIWETFVLNSNQFPLYLSHSARLAIRQDVFQLLLGPQPD